MGPRTAGRALRPLLLADLDIADEFGQLIFGCPGSHLGLRIARVADLDLCNAGDRAVHELLEDRFLDERARRTWADLTLVEGEEGKAFQRLGRVRFSHPWPSI
jgi:hypothetical protein